MLVVGGGQRPDVVVWDISRRNARASVPHRASHCNCLGVGAVTNKVAAGLHDAVAVFDLGTSGIKESHHSGSAHKGNVRSVFFLDEDRQLISAGEDGFLKCCDLRCGEEQELLNCRNSISAAAAGPTEDYIIFGDAGGRLACVDVRTRKICDSQNPNGEVALQSFAVDYPKKMIRASYFDGHVSCTRIFGGTFQAKSCLLTPHTGSYVLKITTSSDGRMTALTSSDKTVSVWEDLGARPEPLFVLKGHRKWVWDCAFAKGCSQIATASSDGTCKIWSKTGRQEHSLEGRQPPERESEITAPAAFSAIAIWESQGIFDARKNAEDDADLSR